MSEGITLRWLQSQKWLEVVEDGEYYKVFNYKKLRLSWHAACPDTPILEWFSMSFGSEYVTSHPSEAQCLAFKKAIDLCN